MPSFCFYQPYLLSELMLLRLVTGSFRSLYSLSTLLTGRNFLWELFDSIKALEVKICGNLDYGN